MGKDSLKIVRGHETEYEHIGDTIKKVSLYLYECRSKMVILPYRKNVLESRVGRVQKVRVS